MVDLLKGVAMNTHFIHFGELYKHLENSPPQKKNSYIIVMERGGKYFPKKNFC